MINIKYIKTAFSADYSKNFDGKNMVQIMGKIWPIYVPYFAHGVFTLKVSEFQFTLPYREWQEYSHKIKLSATQLNSCFLPYNRILAHKRAFFNINFTLFQQNKINPASRIVKNASTPHWRVSFCKIEILSRTFYTYKGDYNYGMENTHKRSIPTD